MIRKQATIYREIFEGLCMVLLGNLAGYGGTAIAPAAIAGLIGIIISNYYHALAGRWVAAFVGVGASFLLFVLGVFL